MVASDYSVAPQQQQQQQQIRTAGLLQLHGMSSTQG
jgi:hypothetical protein